MPNGTPKQLANLRPAKKGEIRNPLGARSHDPIRKQLKRLTGDALLDIINMILQNESAGLKKIMDDPKETAIRRIAAKHVHDAIKSGSWGAIEPLIIRACGKPKETIEIQGDIHSTLVRMIKENNRK